MFQASIKNIIFWFEIAGFENFFENGFLIKFDSGETFLRQFNFDKKVRWFLDLSLGKIV